MITRDMINKMDTQKRRVRKETYTKIYEQFCRKIQNAATMNQKQVMLTIPPFVLGFPMFSLVAASSYIKRQIERSGFDVVVVSPNSLFVSWYPAASQPTKVPPRFVETIAEEDTSLPSLVNLRKAANKYR